MGGTTKRGCAFGVVIIAAAISAPRVALQQPTTQETGIIVVHHIERPIGEEHYRLSWDIDGALTLTSNVAYVDRGGRVESSSSLQARPDLTPVRFEANGKTYRFVNIDAAIDVHDDGTAIVRNLGQTSRMRVSGPFWTARGLAPLAARGLLVRYWERKGRPRRLTVLPDGNDVTIQYRGIDSVRVRGRIVQLRRYAVEGVVWGREAVWLDNQDRFAALLTRIHILPLEAVRDDLQEALPQLQASARRDRIADLESLAGQVVPVASGSFALLGGRVIDGTGRSPIDDAAIVVRNGRIVSVGQRASVRIPHDVRIVSVEGKTVVPGLWDMHGHLSQIEWGPAYLAAGVTSARDVGGERDFLTAFRDALADRGLGPRLLLAGLVDGDGSEAYGMTTAATPEQGRAVVETYHRFGFLQIKLYSRVAPDVVAAISRRAHELGMTVTGHIPNALSVQHAIESGMDQFEHLGPIRGEPDSTEVREIVQFLARRGTVVGPTPAWDELLGRVPTTAISTFEPGILQTPPPLAASYNSVTNEIDVEQAAANAKRRLGIIRKLHDSGVAIVAGTDGAVPGHSLLRTLEIFVEAGMTPAEAIAAATSVPARFMKMEKEVGTIEQGKRADLLVLDADPLINIANVRKGRWVVANGRLYDCAALWRSVGFARIQ